MERNDVEIHTMMLGLDRIKSPSVRSEVLPTLIESYIFVVAYVLLNPRRLRGHAVIRKPAIPAMPPRSILRCGRKVVTVVEGSLKHPRHLSTSLRRLRDGNGGSNNYLDVEELLSKPTWSVSSLLPRTDGQKETPAISSKQLHHLLRLSALPPPKDDQEELEMLRTLGSQLHFVKQIQEVDTTGIEPFRSLRDETAAGEQESELDMAAMKEALASEVVRGKHHKRIRRNRESSAKHGEKWDVLGTADRKVGRYFVVEGGKDA